MPEPELKGLLPGRGPVGRGAPGDGAPGAGAVGAAGAAAAGAWGCGLGFGPAGVALLAGESALAAGGSAFAVEAGVAPGAADGTPVAPPPEPGVAALAAGAGVAAGPAAAGAAPGAAAGEVEEGVGTTELGVAARPAPCLPAGDAAVLRAGVAVFLVAGAEAPSAPSPPPEAATASRSFLAAGASMLEAAPFTYSPSSLSLVTASLLEIPSSFASWWTRTLDTLLRSGPNLGVDRAVSALTRTSWLPVHRVLILCSLEGSAAWIDPDACRAAAATAESSASPRRPSARANARRRTARSRQAASRWR